MRLSLVSALLVLSAAVSTGCGDGGKGRPFGTMSMGSPAFQRNSVLPERFACEGDNVSPPLAWTGAPGHAGSMAIVLTDLDSPNAPFFHWVLLNLGVAGESIEAGEVPTGAVPAEASSGSVGYVGPCPPEGETHRYEFTVYALSRKLDVAPGVPAVEAAAQIRATAIDEAVLQVTYAR